MGSDTATTAAAEPFDYDGGAEVAAAAAASRLLASMARAGAVQEQAVPDVGGGHGVGDGKESRLGGWGGDVEGRLV